MTDGERRRPGWGLWLGWTLVLIAGAILDGELPAFWTFVIGAIPQWLLLRQYMPAANGWLLATPVSGAVAALVAVVMERGGSMASLAGKVAVVTGGSRGIGRAVAERLGKDGASIVVSYVRNAEKAGEVVSAIQSEGGKALAVQADLSRVADVRRLFAETIDRRGHLDILVHGAGVFQPKAVSDVTEEEFDATFALQARGTFFVLQEAARRIRDGGRIVNISSSATAMVFPGAALYVGSKAAGEQFAKTLAKELGGRGITVNSVSPGYTETDMLPKDPDLRERAAGQSAFGRLGRAIDVADVVAFLVSDQARWLTGQNVQAGGGVVMQP